MDDSTGLIISLDETSLVRIQLNALSSFIFVNLFLIDFFCILYGIFVFFTLLKLVFFKLFITFMSKKSLIEREKKRRFLVKKYFSLRKFLKHELIHSQTFEDKLVCSFKLQSLPKNSSPSRLF